MGTVKAKKPAKAPKKHLRKLPTRKPKAQISFKAAGWYEYAARSVGLTSSAEWRGRRD
jgi:hypothetical protein